MFKFSPIRGDIDSQLVETTEKLRICFVLFFASEIVLRVLEPATVTSSAFSRGHSSLAVVSPRRKVI